MKINIFTTNKKYKIIYADPPWRYYTWSKKGQGRSAESHYSTMSIEEICNLPVNELSDDDCALFLWVTYPTLLDGLKCIEAWGFEYKTCAFCWCKRNKKSDGWFTGMGYWTRANSEICLLATKGKPKRLSASVKQIVDAPIGKHSEKPSEVRERIVQLMGDIPRIELFARQYADDWDCWGDEV